MGYGWLPFQLVAWFFFQFTAKLDNTFLDSSISAQLDSFSSLPLILKSCPFQCECCHCSSRAAKATRGDTVCRSFSALSANALVQPRTSFPALSISLSSFGHTSLWACLGLGKQWKIWYQKQDAEKRKRMHVFISIQFSLEEL